MKAQEKPAFVASPIADDFAEFDVHIRRRGLGPQNQNIGVERAFHFRSTAALANHARLKATPVEGGERLKARVKRRRLVAYNVIKFGSIASLLFLLYLIF